MKIRPIVSGEMLTRIAGRGAMVIYKEQWRKVFEPEQLGISVRGTESVVHCARALIQANHSNPHFGFMRIDSKNAFNSYDRDIMLKAVKRYVPELYAFTVWKYGLHIPLFLSDGSKTVE